MAATVHNIEDARGARERGDEGPAPVRLDLGRLGKRAREISEGLTEADRRAILEAKAADAETLSDWCLKRAAPPQTDRPVFVIIAQAVRAGLGEAAMVGLLEGIHSKWKRYKLSWLSAAREVVVSILGAEKRAKQREGRETNMVGQDDFDDLFRYGFERLKVANSAKPTLFRHGTELASVRSVPEIDLVQVVVEDEKGFRSQLSFQAPYFEPKGENDVRNVSAPPDVADSLYRYPDLPLPYLAGVVRIPTFGEDKKLAQTPGYNTGSMVYYEPPKRVTIPDVPLAPTAEDVGEAKELLVTELLADFPFDGLARSDIERQALGIMHEGRRVGRTRGQAPASLLNAIGAMLTPFARPMIGDVCPATLVTKPAPATGASLLVQCMNMIVSGRSEAGAPMPRSEDERRKLLFSALKDNAPFIFFDNVTGEVDSGVLASLLTTGIFKDRELGRSITKALPVNSALIFTGNNPTFTKELQRRLSLVRLDAKTAHPGERGGWRHDDLLAWVSAHRGKLIWACLVLIQHWIAKGCPNPTSAPEIASYGAWRRVIGGILEAADPRWTTFQANRGEIGELAGAGDEDGINELVQAWWDSSREPRGVPLEDAFVKESKDRADRPGLLNLTKAGEIELPDVKKASPEPGDYKADSFGRFLGRYKGRFFELDDGREVELRGGKSGNRGVPWSLVVREKAAA